MESYLALTAKSLPEACTGTLIVCLYKLLASYVFALDIYTLIIEMADNRQDSPPYQAALQSVMMSHVLGQWNV